MHQPEQGSDVDSPSKETKPNNSWILFSVDFGDIP